MSDKEKIPMKRTKLPEKRVNISNRRIKVNVMQTISTGDYENVKIELGMEGDLSADANLQKEYYSNFSEISEILEELKANFI